MSTVIRVLRVAVNVALLLTVSAIPAAAQRISAELKTTQVSVTNDVADATFKVVIHNEENAALTNVWLVFEDGFEVAVGDVDDEYKSSDEQTKTFDLSQDGGTAHVPFKATVKYSVDGESREQAITVVLRLE